MSKSIEQVIQCILVGVFLVSSIAKRVKITMWLLVPSFVLSSTTMVFLCAFLKCCTFACPVMSFHVIRFVQVARLQERVETLEGEKRRMAARMSAMQTALQQQQHESDARNHTCSAAAATTMSSFFVSMPCC